MRRNGAISDVEARGAQDLQSWLNIAKQRALRDQSPRGVRLWVTNATFGPATIPNAVIECQYLEQPDDFSGGNIISFGAPNTIRFSSLPGGDLCNGYVPMNIAEMPFWSVQLGDNLEVLGTGLMYQITGFVDENTVTISPPLPYPLMTATTSYRIVRAPRAVGSEKLTLPEGTMIDLGTNGMLNPLPVFDPNFVDILFSPSGSVISRGLTTSNIHLWVRAPDENNPGNIYYGDPTIVSVFTRTGFVGAFAPAPASVGNPYAFVQ